jgi:DNA-binding transcriptional regulator YdaS (Cro superfamily)
MFLNGCMSTTTLSALQDAVSKAGGQTALARAIGKTQGHISQWLKRKYVPAEDVLKIEAATGVSRHDLRPDIYPREDAQPAPDAA